MAGVVKLCAQFQACMSVCVCEELWVRKVVKCKVVVTEEKIKY